MESALVPAGPLFSAHRTYFAEERSRAFFDEVDPVRRLKNAVQQGREPVPCQWKQL
jgi:hypothetical protein